MGKTSRSNMKLQKAGQKLYLKYVLTFTHPYVHMPRKSLKGTHVTISDFLHFCSYLSSLKQTYHTYIKSKKW